MLGGEQLSRGKELENGNQSKEMGDLKDCRIGFASSWLGLKLP